MISNRDYQYELEEKSPPTTTTITTTTKSDIAHHRDVLNHQAHTLAK